MDKLGEAKRHLEHANYAEKGESVSKCDCNHRISPSYHLEPGGDPAFSEQLADLYDYMERRIFEANSQK